MRPQPATATLRASSLLLWNIVWTAAWLLLACLAGHHACLTAGTGQVGRRGAPGVALAAVLRGAGGPGVAVSHLSLHLWPPFGSMLYEPAASYLGAAFIGWNGACYIYCRACAVGPPVASTTVMAFRLEALSPLRLVLVTTHGPSSGGCYAVLFRTPAGPSTCKAWIAQPSHQSPSTPSHWTAHPPDSCRWCGAAPGPRWVPRPGWSGWTCWPTGSSRSI